MSVSDHTTSIEYRQVQGFPGYRVGDDGSVWSSWTSAGHRYKPSADWHRLKASKAGGKPRLKVNLCRDGKVYNRFVHRLVLEAFVGPCPPGMEACHNDGDPTNNRLSNLRWDSHVSNMADRDAHGKTRRGSRVIGAKLTESQVVRLREEFAAGATKLGLSNRYGVSRGVIKQIVEGRAWRHV